MSDTASQNGHLDTLQADWFDPAFLKQNDWITGYSRGRNQVYFFKSSQIENHTDTEYVLRHYYRGGLFSRFNKDKYLWTHIQETRAYQEIAILEHCTQQKLNAPRAIAGFIQLQGRYYQADIIIEKIPQSKDAFQILCEQPLTTHQWKNIGQCIAQFHKAHIYHSDLNIHNILLDTQDKIWLIDFDKAQIKQSESSWQKDNLQRLLRSLNKEKKKQPSFHWHEKDWQSLLSGYEA